MDYTIEYHQWMNKRDVCDVYDHCYGAIDVDIAASAYFVASSHHLVQCDFVNAVCLTDPI